MTDLTDKWKKGELPEGHYYVKDGKDLIAEYLDGFFYIYGEPMKVDKILAPVSSYEEWKAKLEENTKLKELLRECHVAINEDTIQDLYEMLQKINQVLGEE